MKKPFYITTTLPYVNAEAHLGHALEFVRADVVARVKHRQGHEVFFNTGSDEHGVKIFEKAKEEGIETQVFVDRYAEKLKALGALLGFHPDAPEKGFHSHFIRTTDPHHVQAALHFWKICADNGYIYKKQYTGLYCVGDEAFVKEKDLINGFCPNHPNVPLVTVSEENYFFKYSAFQEKLLELYKHVPDFVIPRSRLHEVTSLVSQGLEDFSISRLVSKMPWGIPVPDDAEHVMYVWFDALVDYISTLGWPHDTASFDKWWNQSGGVVQYCGKDNLQHQAARWQAMLMSVGISPSRQIVVDGFVTAEGGVKMSKSLGNVVSPIDIINEYGTDALRYYVLRELSMFEDSPFSKDLFKNAYNTALANGLGNLVSRVMKMASTHDIHIACTADDMLLGELDPEVIARVDVYEHDKALDIVWDRINALDKYIQDKQPFKTVKTNPEQGKAEITELLEGLVWITRNLSPFLPATAEKIAHCLENGIMPEVSLFARKEYKD